LESTHHDGKENSKKDRGDSDQRTALISPDISPGHCQVILHNQYFI
jgi:hypothetical protein